MRSLINHTSWDPVAQTEEAPLPAIGAAIKSLNDSQCYHNFFMAQDYSLVSTLQLFGLGEKNTKSKNVKRKPSTFLVSLGSVIL